MNTLLRTRAIEHSLRSHENYFSALIVLCCAFSIATGLSCLPCLRRFCKDLASLNCTGGYSLGICNCCKICAKVEHEKCGGLWKVFGKCDKGLKCYNDDGTLSSKGVCLKEDSVYPPLPACLVSKKHQAKEGADGSPCKFERSMFCNKECKNCCLHISSCNPDTQTRHCRITQKVLIPP